MEERTLIEYEPRENTYCTYLGIEMEADGLDDSFDYYEIGLSDGSTHYAVTECTNMVIDYFASKEDLIEIYGI